MAVSAVLAVLVALLAAVWVKFSWNFNYWSKRRVPFCNPLSLFADRGGGLGEPVYEQMSAVYKKYRGKTAFAGAFLLNQPVLVVLEPELAKTVMTKEFASFPGRGFAFDTDRDPLFANLLNLEGPRWKNLRAKLSATFTSGKLKVMFPLVADITAELKDMLRRVLGEEVNMSDIMMRYCTDVIGSVAFGISCNSLKNPNAEFLAVTREVTTANWTAYLRMILVSIHPVFMKLLPFQNIIFRTTNFFVNLMKNTVEYREKNKVERNDFVQILMQLRDSELGIRDRAHHVELTPEVMAAQGFAFFLAGLDNVAYSICFALHELAVDPHLQQRAAEEVRGTTAKHGFMSYVAVKEMELLERIVKETLRKWTPLGFISRGPSGPFTIPDSDVVIDRTALVWIPTWQFHHDPELYPQPERFDPDRFTGEATAQRHPYAYLPFGEGPRFCIAERFAMLEMKLCLASLLQEFEFHVGQKTASKLQLDTKKHSPQPKGGFWLRVQKRAA